MRLNFQYHEVKFSILVDNLSDQRVGGQRDSKLFEGHLLGVGEHKIGLAMRVLIAQMLISIAQRQVQLRDFKFAY